MTTLDETAVRALVSGTYCSTNNPSFVHIQRPFRGMVMWDREHVATLSFEVIRANGPQLPEGELMAAAPALAQTALSLYVENATLQQQLSEAQALAEALEKDTLTRVEVERDVHGVRLSVPMLLDSETGERFCTPGVAQLLYNVSQALAASPATPTEAELEAEIQYHRSEADKHVKNPDLWWGHVSVETVLTDKLNLIKREAHWRSKLAQALAPAESEV